MFLDGKGYAGIAKTLQSEGILSPPKYRFYKAGKTEFAEKAREWHYSHVKEILQGEYYIGNIVHGKQRKALDTGRKNKKTDKSKWQRVENAHEPIIDKDTFYRVQITELLYRRSLYEKDFHIDEGWEETVNKYLSKRKLTREEMLRQGYW